MGTEPPLDEHPRGTLALVTLLGLFFVVGWLAVYVFIFLARGAPHT